MAVMADSINDGSLIYKYVIDEDGISITNVTCKIGTYPNIWNVPSSLTIDGNTYPVVRIKSNVFKSKYNSQSVNLLSEINIPDSVKEIETGAFHVGVPLLKKLKFPRVCAGRYYETSRQCELWDARYAGWLESLFVIVYPQYTTAGEGATRETGYRLASDGKMPQYLNSVEISGGESIPAYSFYDSVRTESSVFTVKIPETVTNIGDYAFWGSKIPSIRLPGGLLHIGENAFQCCSQLKDFVIPDSVIGEIPNLSGANQLTNITVGSGITSCRSVWQKYFTVVNKQYEDTPRLNSVSVSDIGAWCRMSFATSENNPLSIAHNLYIKGGGLITNLKIPSNVNTIGQYAFYGGSKIEKVTIPNSVTHIGREAFTGCKSSVFDTQTMSGFKLVDGWIVERTGGSPSTLTLEGIRGIADYALEGCALLADFDTGSSVKTIGNGSLKDCASLKRLTIGSSVTTIGDCAFAGCTNLEEIVFMGNVQNVGQSPFPYMRHLKTVYVDKNCNMGIINDLKAHYPDAEFIEFKGDPNLLAYFNPGMLGNVDLSYKKVVRFGKMGELPIPTRGGYTFIGWSNGREIVNEDTIVDELDDFWLRAQWTPNKYVATFDANGGEGGYVATFEYGERIRPPQVSLSGHTFIKWEPQINYAFYMPAHDVYYTACWEVATPSFEIDDDGCLVKAVTKNVTGTVVIPDGVVRIGEKAFKGQCFDGVVIPDSVIEIGKFAFEGCTNLTSVTIGNSVVNIMGGAFWGCTRLTQISIPDSVRNIGGSAFYECSGLTEVTIPGSVTNIGNYAFERCTNLTYAVLCEGVKTIGHFAFGRCINLSDLSLPSSLTRIGQDAFRYCNLSYVELPVCSSDYSFDDDVEVFVYMLHQTITLNAAGGSVSPGTVEVEWRTPYGTLPTPTREGFRFLGWKNLYNEDEMVSADTIVTTPHNHTLFAQWKDITHTVTFDANGGEGGWSEEMEEDTPLTPPTVTRTGYTFRGWEPSVPVFVPDADVVYTAQWAVNRYTLVFDPNNGEDSLALMLEFGEEIVPPPFGREGYTFAGWTPSIEGGVPAEDVVYTAKWTINNYDVTFDANGGVGGWSRTMEYGEEITPPTVTRIGHTFRGWDPAADAIVPSSNVVYTAMWECDSIAEFLIDQNCCLTGVVFNGQTDIVVPDGVRAIANRAFKNSAYLTSVVIPNNVTNVEEYAFENCSSLTNVIIASKAIGGGAFADCSSLTVATLVDGVESIGLGAFADCSSLRKITIPDSVVDIGGSAFGNCVNLSGVAIGDGVKSIGAAAFYNCTNLVELTIPEGVTSIERVAFQYCKGLTSIVIPDSVTNIGYRAFQYCTALGNVIIGNGVENIGFDAFDSCTSITNLLIGNGVKTIESCAFNYCTALSKVIFTGDAPLTAESAFDSCMIYVPKGSHGWDDDGDGRWLSFQILWYVGDPMDPTVSFQVTFDANGGEGGWSRAMEYGEEIVPPTVTRNGYTFVGWSPSVAATVPNRDVTYTAQWTNKYIVTFDANGGVGGWSRTMEYGETIVPPTVTQDGYTFVGWSPSVAPTVPAGNVTYRAQWRVGPSFTCSLVQKLIDAEPERYYEILNTLDCVVLNGNTEIQIPEGVENIGYGAFNSCAGLVSIVLPSTVRYIAEGAFRNCNDLRSITVDSSNSAFSSSNGLLLSKNGKRVIVGINGDVIVPDGVTHIAEDAFAGRRNLKSLVIPAGVVSIGSFDNCTNLRSIVIPDGVESVGSFYNCRSLTSITIPNGVLSVGSFCNCINLKSITIPESVASVGSFDGCTNLKSVAIPYGITVINDRGFAGCTSLTDITLPDSITWIGASAFSGCIGLTCLTIPSGVTEIGRYAFSGCDGLKLIFNGEAPNMDGDGDGIGAEKCVAYVKASVSFDNSNLFRTIIRMSETIQTMPTYSDSAWLVTNKIENTGFIDEDAVKSVINGNADEYRRFKAWAQSTDDGETAVIMSTRAAKSYLFGAKTLLDKELTSDDVKIESFSPTSTDGKFDFTVSVKDVNIGGGSVETESLKENLKKVLGVEGAASLTPDAFSSDNIDITFGAPVNGKAKITVSPPAYADNSFFMRVKVK